MVDAGQVTRLLHFENQRASMSLPPHFRTCAALAVCVMLVVCFPVASSGQQAARSFQVERVEFERGTARERQAEVVRT